VVVAELSAGLVSCVVELAVTVSLMTVPEAVPAVTLTTTGKLTKFPGAMLEIVQVRVRGFPDGAGQVQPAGSGVSDTKVVLVGITSVNWTPVATLGPLLVSVCV
jgi:hypothetical protein